MRQAGLAGASVVGFVGAGVVWLAAAGLLVACGGDGATRTLRLGHGLDASHPVHRAMAHMAARIETRSGGRLRLLVHPSEQLGSERECLELLQIGSLAMTKVSSAVLEGFVPEFSLLSLPYLFRDEAHRFAVLEGEIGRALLRSAEPYRLRGLAYYDAGTRSFYTRERPVRTPADLRGLKIRTQESPVAMALVNALGAAATPVAWGELYTALQEGVVDGAENNPPSFHLSRHYEVARYYTLDRHTAVPDVLLMSTSVWAALTAEERAWLEAAVAESVLLQRRLWKQASREALEAVVADGVEVVEPDPAAFAAAVEPLYATYRADPVLGPWIARIRGGP